MLGDQIRGLREGRCWSQAHLADAAALNVRTVQRIEAGEPCSFETMMSLAAALDVDVAVLEPVLVPQKANASFWRLAVATACLLPLLLFVVLNLLRSVAGVDGPYQTVAMAGSKIVDFRTFNSVSPIFFIGGGLATLVVSISSFLGIQRKKEGRTMSITALELTADWAAVGLALAAFCSLTILVGYAALELLFTRIN